MKSDNVKKENHRWKMEAFSGVNCGVCQSPARQGFRCLGNFFFLSFFFKKRKIFLL